MHVVIDKENTEKIVRLSNELNMPATAIVNAVLREIQSVRLHSKISVNVKVERICYADPEEDQDEQ